MNKEVHRNQNAEKHHFEVEHPLLEWFKETEIKHQYLEKWVLVIFVFLLEKLKMNLPVFSLFQIKIAKNNIWIFFKF